MKKVLAKLLTISGCALLILPSCKNSNVLTVSNGGKAGSLTASATTLVMNKNDLNDTTSVINFNFTAAQYGYSAAVTNTLQIDVASDNWANPIPFVLGTKVYAQGFSTSVFNALLLKLNLAAGVASPVEVRIEHTIGTYVAPVYSNVVSVTVTPFDLTSWLYVTGAFQGWNAASPDSLISATGNGVYTGIIDFTAGNNAFLILPAKNFNNKYGTTQTSTPTSTVAYNAANNLLAPTAAGYYIVTFDENAGTITFTAADYYSVIGGDFTTVVANQWNVDYPMKYINDGTNTWTATVDDIDPAGGGFKVRQDDAWTNSWGTSGTAGTLTDASGGNITVSTAGNYTVNFIMAPTAYGSPAVTLAPYTVTLQ